MDFTKNVMLVFKNYLLSIIYEYKTTFYVFIILACLNLTNYFRFNNFDVKIQDIIFMFENGFITIFFIFNMMTLTIIIFENNKEFPNKNLTLREIVTGKILAVYIFIITIIITIFIGRFIEFIRANLLYNLLPLISFFINMLIIVFLYCTISVLIASIKNKISIIIYITFVIIYTIYSYISLITYNLSHLSIITRIFYGKLYPSIAIHPIIDSTYTPIHFILSVALIYFISPFIENK